MAPLIQGHAGWCGYKQTPRRHSFTVGLSGSLQFIRPFILTALLSCQQSSERHISITLLSHQKKQKLIRVTDLLKDWHPGQGHLWTPNPMPTTLWHDGSQWSLPARLSSLPSREGGRLPSSVQIPARGSCPVFPGSKDCLPDGHVPVVLAPELRN